MELKEILVFLNNLQANNNRDWFNKNRTEYNKAKESFEIFTDMLINEISSFDKSVEGTKAKQCMFRIYRDVRFSKNKEPYKSNFGSFIAKGGRKSHFAGYYIHMEPGASFIGGGVYMPPADNLRKIRKRIYNSPHEFIDILNDKDFKKYFDGIYGEKLKTAPKGFPKDWEHIELLNHKHYAVAHPVSDEFWKSKDIITDIMSIFKAQNILNSYLNQIVE